MVDLPPSSPLPSLTDEKTSPAPQLSPQRSQSPVDSEEEGNLQLSEMEKLQLEYTKDRKLDVSTAMRILQLGSRTSIERINILDRGLSLSKEYPRFAITEDFSSLLETTVTEMQSILDRAGHLVPRRRNIFVVDPRNSLISILKGAQSLDEMNVGWVALSKRLQLAHKYLEKYGKEYRNDAEDPAPDSPTSTVAGLYSRMPMHEGNQSQLSFLFHNVFHHREQIPKEYRERDPYWLNRALPASDGLHEAFPEREKEENPSTIYYSATGTRMEQFSSDRSSWRKNQEEFDLPPATQNKGKGANPSERPKDYVRFQEQGAKPTFTPNTDIPHPLRGLASAGPYPNYGDLERVLPSPAERKAGTEEAEEMMTMVTLMVEKTVETALIIIRDVKVLRRPRAMAGTEAEAEVEVEVVTAGNAYRGYPHVADGAPYGATVPTVEPKFKVDSLPGREPLDRDRLLLGGRSAGGSTWMDAASFGFLAADAPKNWISSAAVVFYVTYLEAGRNEVSLLGVSQRSSR
ncbi:hypothetical protein C8R46DRAFT_1236714 [Mycena filopes]|nr:hypothetical protein C8R46DRAFT_1236714 [Mycena filopes]